MIGVGEKKVKLRCPISQREFEWHHFCYYVEELKHPHGTTFRIRNRARTENGKPEVVADISPIERIPYVRRHGLNLETLAHRESAIRKMLANPEALYRREKDIKNLGYVIRYRRALKNMR